MFGQLFAIGHVEVPGRDDGIRIDIRAKFPYPSFNLHNPCSSLRRVVDPKGSRIPVKKINEYKRNKQFVVTGPMPVALRP
jgi:hypothetical protein